MAHYSYKNIEQSSLNPFLKRFQLSSKTEGLEIKMSESHFFFKE